MTTDYFDSAEHQRIREKDRAYWAGEWCGECAYGVVEDPPCCTHPQPTDPHPDAHCAEYVKRRGFCGDIECFCPCHQPNEPEVSPE